MCTPSSTDAARYRVALSTSIIVHVRACPGLAPFRSQNYPFSTYWNLDPIYYMVPWPTRVHIPNGISIGSAVLAGLTVATDRPTGRSHYFVYSVLLRCGLIIIPVLMRTVPSLRHRRFPSSPISFDEWRFSARWPPTFKPSHPSWAAIAHAHHRRLLLLLRSKADTHFTVPRGRKAESTWTLQ